MSCSKKKLIRNFKSREPFEFMHLCIYGSRWKNKEGEDKYEMNLVTVHNKRLTLVLNLRNTLLCTKN